MIVVRDVGPAAWAFSAFAKFRGENVTLSTEPTDCSERGFSPLTGFDRNQPFRRILGTVGTELPLKRLDPGVVYHFGNQEKVRPAPVEGWIKECSDTYPGKGARDFWESIWNLSLIAWNYIDLLGIEPWQPPNPGFPYLNPCFWQGLSRNRLLFANTSDYLETLPIDRKDHLRVWVDALLRFTYGKGVENTPLGMAALALNAPAESYRLGEGFDSIRRRWLEDRGLFEERASRKAAVPSQGWIVGFETGFGLGCNDIPVHQFFFLTSPIEGLHAQTAVLVKGSEGRGKMFVRLERDSPKEAACEILKEVQRRIESDLPDCGRIDCSSASPAEKLAVEWEGMAQETEIEADWPWLGQVRSFVSAKRWLETIRKD